MITYCKKCFTPSTRPRVTFNNDGVCNACVWAEEKKKINWDERQKYFVKLCDSYRGNGKDPDVIVPWSGGKDSIYVAYKMKEFGMTPLLITILPHLETEIGKWNRVNMCSYMEHLDITLTEDKYKSLAKKYFIKDGRPKHPWETAISATVINKAADLNIPFIIYGEEGEQEYGGVSRERDRWMLPIDQIYLKDYYWQNNLDWGFPSDKQFAKMFFTQWSKFEDWSPTKHADFAIDKGMKVRDKRNIGTITCDSQLSDDLQDLHAYMMFVKYGFGRCTGDANIKIREGNWDREMALELIELYDGEFPNQLLDKYLDYFDMTKDEFTNTVNKFGNRDMMDNIGYVWYLKEWAAKHRRRETPQEYINPNRFTMNRRTYKMGN